MASARKKNGKWYYRITLTIGDGSHKYIERGSFKTKREAIEAGTKAEVLYKNGEDISRQKVISFYFLQKEWFSNAKSYYKQGSIDEIAKTLRSDIVPVLGNYMVSAINTSMCQAIIDGKVSSRRSYSCLKRIRSVLNNIFRYGIRQGYLKENPMDNVMLPAARSENRLALRECKHTKVMPKEEVDAIFNRFPEGSSIYIPLLLGYRCGLRHGEAFGVFIEDIDFKQKRLHVRRQIQYDTKNHLYFTDLKYSNPGDERVIDLDDETLRSLRRHINKIVSLSSINRFPIYKVNEDHILNKEVGEIIHPINIRYEDGSFVPPRAINHVTQIIHGHRSSIDYVDPYWDFHTLRHTHASECIAAGMDPTSVQRRLGHKSLSTTYKYYIHETDTQVTKSRDILNKMFN